MSIDCGQYSGVKNCRFMTSANAYFSLEEAYAEQEIPSEAMALRSYCAQGMNASEANNVSAFKNQAFGAFNVPAAGPSNQPAK